MITLLVRDARWRKVRGLSSRLKRAAAAALAEAGAEPPADLSIVLSTDAHLKSLNRAFRRKDAATNVLSFPSGRGDYLGDVAIAYGVAAREARAAGKTLRDHAVHLAVHGVLHLAGFDHATARQARAMEPKEVRVLRKLRIADPYRGTA